MQRLPFLSTISVKIKHERGRDTRNTHSRRARSVDHSTSLLYPNLARIRLIRKKLRILASVNPRATSKVTRNRVQAYLRKINQLATDSFPFRLHLMFFSFLRSVSQRRNRVFAKSETRSLNTNVFLLSVKSRRPFSFTMKIEDGEDALPCSKKNSFPFR